ncbi:hypothetical protein, partial [Staphylococcus pseudintermedius]|uniref:hypothetical protein n=1 Tax=Staphylococcus pseudintermedius TaxID=283734 RepID=UPI001A904B44
RISYFVFAAFAFSLYGVISGRTKLIDSVAANNLFFTIRTTFFLYILLMQFHHNIFFVNLKLTIY